MSNEEKNISIEDQEVLEAQRRLEAATAKRTALEAQRLAKAQEDLQAHLHAQEMERAAEREKYRIIEAQWIEKRRLEDEAREAERREKERAQRELEENIAKVEAEKLARLAKEAEARRISEAAFVEEQAALQLEREILNLTTVAKPDPVITIMSPSHPLSRIFNPSGSTQVEPEAPAPLHVDPIEAPIRREVTAEQMNLVAGMYQRISGIRPYALQIKNLLMVWEPLAIEQAVSYVHGRTVNEGRVIDGNAFFQEVECILSNPGCTSGR